MSISNIYLMDIKFIITVYPDSGNAFISGAFMHTPLINDGEISYMKTKQTMNRTMDAMSIGVIQLSGEWRDIEWMDFSKEQKNEIFSKVKYLVETKINDGIEIPMDFKNVSFPHLPEIRDPDEKVHRKHITYTCYIRYLNSDKIVDAEVFNKNGSDPILGITFCDNDYTYRRTVHMNHETYQNLLDGLSDDDPLKLKLAILCEF